MQTALLIAQFISGLFLALLILLQEKGSGLGEAIGGTGASYQSVKRGAEKVLANLTIVLVVLFVGFSLTLNFI